MGLLDLFRRKGKEKELTIKVPRRDIEFFRKKAEEKIYTERWVGRRRDIKINNFVNCWITEEAFKQILMQRKIWFRHRGLYVGDAKGAVNDFEVRIGGEIKAIGIRSLTEDSMKKWRTVAYPDDRFRDEKDKIADFTVVCYNDGGRVSFLGEMEKRRLLEELGNSRRLYSRNNQEYFRIVGLGKFSFEKLRGLLERMEGVE